MIVVASFIYLNNIALRYIYYIINIYTFNKFITFEYGNIQLIILLYIFTNIKKYYINSLKK